MTERCDIIIPVWNQLEVTRECVDSIVKHTDYPHRLIIIDNASDKPTADFLESLKGESALDLLLIRNNKNLGFVKAVNQGIAASDAPYLCIMNNDTIATDGWLNELVHIMETDKTIGLVNPSSNTSGEFPATGQSIDEYAKELRSFRGLTQELYTCRGFCMLVRRQVIAYVGLLDEIYHLGYFDDTDYCKRAQLKGFKTVRAKGSYVYHKENTTFKGLKDNSELFKNNERLFFKRWGVPLRVGYVFGDRSNGADLDRIATDVARNGHQIVVFTSSGTEWPVKLDHFDIRKASLHPFFFHLTALYKIIKKRKKKCLHVVVTDETLFGSMLNLTKPLHGAKVFINPDKKELIEELSKLSHEMAE